MDEEKRTSESGMDEIPHPSSETVSSRWECAVCVCMPASAADMQIFMSASDGCGPGLLLPPLLPLLRLLLCDAGLHASSALSSSSLTVLLRALSSERCPVMPEKGVEQKRQSAVGGRFLGFERIEDTAWFLDCG